MIAFNTPPQIVLLVVNVAASAAFKGSGRIPHAVVGFVSMRNTIPTQAEVERQAAVYAPVVLCISGPGNVVPLAGVLQASSDSGSGAEQHVSEVVPAALACGQGASSIVRVTTVEGGTAHGSDRGILGLFVERPASAEFELVGAVGP